MADELMTPEEKTSQPGDELLHSGSAPDAEKGGSDANTDEEGSGRQGPDSQQGGGEQTDDKGADQQGHDEAPGEVELPADDWSALHATYSADRIGRLAPRACRNIRGIYQHNGRGWVAIRVGEDAILAFEAVPATDAQRIAGETGIDTAGALAEGDRVVKHRGSHYILKTAAPAHFIRAGGDEAPPDDSPPQLHTPDPQRAAVMRKLADAYRQSIDGHAPADEPEPHAQAQPGVQAADCTMRDNLSGSRRPSRRWPTCGKPAACRRSCAT